MAVARLPKKKAAISPKKERQAKERSADKLRTPAEREAEEAVHAAAAEAATKMAASAMAQAAAATRAKVDAAAAVIQATAAAEANRGTPADARAIAAASKAAKSAEAAALAAEETAAMAKTQAMSTGGHLGGKHKVDSTFRDHTFPQTRSFYLDLLREDKLKHHFSVLERTQEGKDAYSGVPIVPSAAIIEHTMECQATAHALALCQYKGSMGKALQQVDFNSTSLKSQPFSVRNALRGLFQSQNNAGINLCLTGSSINVKKMWGFRMALQELEIWRSLDVTLEKRLVARFESSSADTITYLRSSTIAKSVVSRLRDCEDRFVAGLEEHAGDGRGEPYRVEQRDELGEELRQLFWKLTT